MIKVVLSHYYYFKGFTVNTKRKWETKRDNIYEEFKVVKSYKMFPEMFPDLYALSDILVGIHI